ncbi:MAG: hypothetical protein WAU91_00090, partial [Desulfatitalea sp.]
QDKQDRVILDRVKTAPPKILELFFVTDYEWQYNRPEPERWVSLVETLSKKNFWSSDEKRIIKTLRSKESDYEKFGLMLDRPTQEDK